VRCRCDTKYTFSSNQTHSRIQVLRIQLFFDRFFGTLQGSGVHGLYYFLRSFEAADMFVYIVNHCCPKARAFGKLLDMLVVSEMCKARDILSVDLMVHMDDMDGFGV
jgi:hypothetical protein